MAWGLSSSASKGGAASSSLLADLPRGDPDRAPPDNDPTGFKPPSSMFATSADIQDVPDLSYCTGKLFLGVIDGRMANPDTMLDRHVMDGTSIGVSDDRHMVTIAGSRAGKGRSVIVPNMLLYPGSVLATDPKGELATITARQREKTLGQAVHVLDPFNTVSGHAATLRRSFNPMAMMRPDALIEDASLMADALVVQSPDRDPHWDESARSFIEGVILHVATAARYKDKRSLVTVGELIALGVEVPVCAEYPEGGHSFTGLDAHMRSNTSVAGAVRAAAADFFDRPARERDSVLSSARRHLKFLRYPGISNVLQGNNFDLADLKTKPTTIYLCLPARHIGTCSRWLRLFINLTLQTMEKVKGPPPGDVPVLLALDEFAQLGHMRQIEDAAGQIAGFDVKLWPILQDLGQLKALYKDRWETFLGNAGVLQFFGNNDLTTLEWVSKRCGQTSIDALKTNALTASQTHSGAKGENRSIEVYSLMGVEEVARYFNRNDHKLRQLVLWASSTQPLILQRIYYDKHKVFAGLWD